MVERRETVEIVVRERGTRVVRRNIRDIGTAATGSARSVGFLQRALGLFGGFLIARSLGGLLDDYTEMQNRLRVVTDGTLQLNAVTDELVGVANRARQELGATAAIYSRLAIATEDLGTSQREVLNLTESLSKASIIGGAGAEEARNGLIQLGQGLASGALRGDELRSVLEQLPVVAGVIADEMGVTRGQLRALGAEGKITSEVVLSGFRNAREELNEQFRKTLPTLGQGFTRLGNSARVFFGRLNERFQVTQRLTQFMGFLAENLDQVARGAAGVGVVLLALKLAPFLDSVRLGTGLVGLFTKSMDAASGGVARFTLALATNPLGLALVAISAVVAGLVAFRDELKVSEDGLATVGDVGAVVWERLRGGLASVVEFARRNFAIVAEVAESVFGDIDFSFGGLVRAAARGLDFYVGAWIGAYNAVLAVWNGFPEAFLDVVISALNGFIGFVETNVDLTTALFLTLFSFLRKAGEGFLAFFVDLGRATAFSLSGNFTKAAEAGERALERLRQGTIDNVAGLPRAFLDQFEQLDEVDLLPRLSNQFAGSGRDLAKKVVEGFLSGLNFDGAERFVDDVFAEAEARARQREGARQLDETGPDLTAPRGAGAVGAGVGSTRDAFREILSDLEREAELLRLLNPQREVRVRILQAEAQLTRSGQEITDAQRDQLRIRSEELVALGEQARLLEEVRGPALELAEQQRAANALFAEGRITLLEYNQVLDDLALRSAQAGDSIGDGVVRGLRRVRDAVTDSASLVEEAFARAFRGAEDAFVDFVKTGRFNISSLVDGVLSDLARLGFRQALSLFLPSQADSIFGGFRAEGGDVFPGRSYVVGERGPELFQPNQPGVIVPNRDLVRGALPPAAVPAVSVAAPQVHLAISNVRDPRDAEDAILSARGERAVLNVISRHARRIRKELA